MSQSLLEFELPGALSPPTCEQKRRYFDTVHTGWDVLAGVV
jgi:hypothetical protein